MYRQRPEKLDSAEAGVEAGVEGGCERPDVGSSSRTVLALNPEPSLQHHTRLFIKKKRTKYANSLNVGHRPAATNLNLECEAGESKFQANLNYTAARCCLENQNKTKQLQ